MRKLLLLIAACILPCLSAVAQNPPTVSQPIVRYHFGDDPDGKLGWASPDFDDSAWPMAKDGQWPVPPFYSDGVVWIRFHVPVPANVAGALAIRQLDPLHWPSAEELFVDGVLVGGDGRLPPNPEEWVTRRATIFDLPVGDLAASTIPAERSRRKSAAVVVLRAWYAPYLIARKRQQLAAFEIDLPGTLQTADRADRASALLLESPTIALHLLLGLFGVALLFLWRRTGREEMLWCGAFIGMGAIADALRMVPEYLSLHVPWSVYWSAYFLMQTVQMWVTIRFVWTIFKLSRHSWLRAALVALLLYNLAAASARFADHPSLWIQVLLALTLFSVTVFNLLTLWVELPILFWGKTDRALAAAMVLYPIASMVFNLGFGRTLTVNSVSIDLFGAGFVLSGFVLAIMFTQRAWQAMRKGDELRVEFEAAHQVQQQHVTPARDLPGFQIHSAYIPALHVGGDFFFIRGGNGGAYQDNRDLTGGAFVVVGDVSGKGLRAAMTVSAIIGALRTMRDLSPARVLAALNRGLVGQLGGGFVTCCAITIAADGTAILASAGHIPPYLGGEEVPIENGLPLGLIPGVEYAETTTQLAPHAQLTLLTDGVLEATNPSGELFGFDRTAAISTQSAEAIASSAQAFGQDDDITVLTLERTVTA